MELKPGYKQTEVGVIPEDWDVEPLVRVCEPKGIVRGPFGGALKKEIFVATGFKVYEQRNAIYKSCATGSYFIDQPKYSEMQRFSVAPGDFIVSCSGTIGCIYMLPYDAPEGVINQALLKLRVNGDVAMPGFFYIYFGWDDLQARIVDSTQGGAMKNLVGMSIFKNTPIVLPPRPEQNAIASALGDMNALLSSLEQLLAKKQEIKQAAMQELLTGKQRLPGFEGEWKVKRLGDEIRDLEAGVSVRSTTDKDQASTGRYILKTSAISKGQFFPTERKEIISSDISRAKTPIKQGDLIISRMNTPALVGECGYSHSDHLNLYLPDRLWRAAYRDPKAVSSHWLAYTLSSQHNRVRIKELATGTSGSMKNISKRALLDLEIKWPSLEEQIAIAEILSEMDADIGAISEHLLKAQGIKQGMMQQLLTGKIRLT